jgi:putative membrane protein
MYEWLKALHIIFMVTWFAGLFYLPRLYVYHAMPENSSSFELFKIMERRLYIMMTIGGTLTAIFGLSLFFMAPSAYLSSIWFPLKVILLLSLIGYHIWCRQLMIAFREERNQHDHKWYRYFNEAPSLLLIVIVVLVVLKPF